MIDKVRTDIPYIYIYIYMTVHNLMQVGLIYKGNEMQIPLCVFIFELRCVLILHNFPAHLNSTQTQRVMNNK